jgi:Neprosin
VSKPTRVMTACAIAGAAFLISLSSATAASTTPIAQPKRLFTCHPRQADIASPPPFAPPAPGTAAGADVAPPPLCPPGEVPISRTRDAAKGPPPGLALSAAAKATYRKRYGVRAAAAALRRSGRARSRRRARAAMEGQFGFFYGYGAGSARFPWQEGTNAWFGTQTNETPLIDHADLGAHSLSQLWGIDDTPGPTLYSDVEEGWNIDYNLYRDYHAHLFTFMFDYGNPGCYNVDTVFCGPGQRGYFVQSSTSAFPGMLVQSSDGSVHTYGVQQVSGNWWVYYDGQWLGYYPPSSYPSYHNSGFLRVDAGGEVESRTSSAACSDMGNGRFPSTHASAHWGSVWRQFNGTATDYVHLSPTDADSSAWNSAFYNTTGGFLYGGSGYPGC